MWQITAPASPPCVVRCGPVVVEEERSLTKDLKRQDRLAVASGAQREERGDVSRAVAARCAARCAARAGRWLVGPL